MMTVMMHDDDADDDNDAASLSEKCMMMMMMASLMHESTPAMTTLTMSLRIAFCFAKGIYIAKAVHRIT